MHRDLRARTSIAIHHSTFVGEDEAQWSIQLLKQACDMLDRPSVQFERHCGNGQENGGEVGEGGRFVVLDIGGTVCV